MELLKVKTMLQPQTGKMAVVNQLNNTELISKMQLNHHLPFNTSIFSLGFIHYPVLSLSLPSSSLFPFIPSSWEIILKGNLCQDSELPVLLDAYTSSKGHFQNLSIKAVIPELVTLRADCKWWKFQRGKNASDQTRELF